jgi:serine/threonine-protein kinase
MAAMLAGRYELVGTPFEGPIFSTQAGREVSSGRDVCIRLFKPPYNNEPDFTSAVAAAARKAAAVTHPGVEPVEELVSDKSNIFLVGPFTPGISLAERMRKLAPFSVPVAVGSAISILEGLDALHTAGIVHGDISAENIVITADGSARLQMAAIWEAYKHSATAGAVVLPAMAPYLAPEVSSGSMPSPQSDVYAVGVLLFELLCGRPPYTADTAVAMAMRHATAPIPSVKMYAPSVPTVLDEIVKKAMSRETSVRYRNAGAMLADLRILQDALRFGRTLTWPLKGSATTPSELEPVAPKMSAARRPRTEPTGRSPKHEVEEEGVARWIVYGFVLCATLILGMIIMYAFNNATKPKMVAVPSLLGKDVNEAKTILRQSHLILKEGPTQPNTRYPADAVIATDPDYGERVAENSSVTVTLSTGTNLVAVPDVTGLELDTAKSVLRKLDLHVEEPVNQADSSKPRDEVTAQEPKANEKVNRDSGVRLTISTGNPTAAADAAGTGDNGTNPTDATNPSSEDATHNYSLKIKLTDATQGVNVKVEIDDSQGTRTVYEGTHDVGDEFTVEAKGYGPEATFNIYYDDELKKTLHETAPKPRTHHRRVKKPVEKVTTPPAPTEPTNP